MAFRLACILVVFALRFFAHTAPIVPAIDAPPPPLETHLAAVTGAADDAPADDPSDLDDDDDDDDDVALSERPVAVVPVPTAVRLSWSIRTLADKYIRESLFRPPRSV